METPSRYRTESYHPIPLSATSLAFTIHLAPKPTAAFRFLFLVRLPPILHPNFSLDT